MSDEETKRRTDAWTDEVEPMVKAVVRRCAELRLPFVAVAELSPAFFATASHFPEGASAELRSVGQGLQAPAPKPAAPTRPIFRLLKGGRDDA